MSDDHYIYDETNRHRPLRLQDHNRSREYRVMLYLVLKRGTIRYRVLVERMAQHIDADWAMTRQQQKRGRRLAPTERTIHAGRKDLARYLISRGVRNNRLSITDPQDGAGKIIHLGDPPASGGAKQVRTDWAWEWNRLEDIAALVDPTRPFERRATGVASAWDRDEPDRDVSPADE